MQKGNGNLDRQLKNLPDKRKVGAPIPPVEPQKTLQQVCRGEIENLHGIFVCWFKGLQSKEELEKELTDRITANFSHIAPNGQFLKGRANLLHNLLEKYNCYPAKAFDVQIENVKVVWTHNELCLVTYEEWQWWRFESSDTNSSSSNLNGSSHGTNKKKGAHAHSESEDVVRCGRLCSCLLKQRPGNFHWVHVHETWLEGVGPSDVLSAYDGNNSESSGSYDVQVTYKKGDVQGKGNGKARTSKALGYENTADESKKEDGEHHVHFNSQREEASYAYKKSANSDKRDDGKPEGKAKSVPKEIPPPKAKSVPKDIPPPKQAKSVPKDTTAKSSKNKKTKNADKAVVQTTAIPLIPPAPSASRRRHISPQLTDYAKACMVNNEVIGISIHGWDIGTGQGPMGDEGWFTAATTNFENASQYRGSSSNKTARRRVALPEMVFPSAHVAFEHRKENIWISWDVLDAMDAWAKAHQHIPLDSDKEHNGVSVLKSEDAELWAKKKKNIIPDSSKSKDNFHFDWTYSSPFCGSVEGGVWDPIPTSGLKLEMLKDKSVPILFFDELILYEDDLHDNGHVQFSLKIRVMPTCGFVLARVWVRIDRVLLRLKETRLLFEFGKTPEETTQIYRDVTWRECYWKDLSEHKLPTNLKVWATEGQETPQLAMLMSKLPEISLPKGIHKHAVLKRTGKLAPKETEQKK